MRRGDLYFSAQCAVECIVRWSTIASFDAAPNEDCRAIRLENKCERGTARAAAIGLIGALV
jgi:hypothetical protein